MTALVISIIMALISSFVAKKSGADDKQAALAGIGAGLGTYYVATQTDWGKGVITDIDAAWDKLLGKDGEPILDGQGNEVKAPPGSKVVYNADGSVKRDPVTNNPVVELGRTVGDVLESWGPTGTAGVIGATAVATDDKLKKWLPWLAGGVIVLMVLK